MSNHDQLVTFLTHVSPDTGSIGNREFLHIELICGREQRGLHITAAPGHVSAAIITRSPAQAREYALRLRAAADAASKWADEREPVAEVRS